MHNTSYYIIFRLTPHLLEFFLDLVSADLCISRSDLNSWRPLLCHMSEIIRTFFQCPSRFSCTKREIMAQVMERKIGYHVPLIVVCPPLESTKPMVNTRFCQLLAPL